MMLSVLHRGVRALRFPFHRSFSLKTPVWADLPKSPDGYLLDTRRGSRRVLDAKWKSPHGGKEFRLEFADHADQDLLQQVFTRIFTDECPMYKGKNLPYDALKPVISMMTEVNLQANNSMLAFDGDKLVGFRVGRYLEGTAIEETLGPLGVGGDIDWPVEFGKIIDSIETDQRTSAQIAVFLGTTESNIGRFLPKDIKKILVNDAVGMSADYMRYGIGRFFTTIGDQLAIDAGADGGFSITVAVASHSLRRKLGYKELFSIPYNRFLDHGVQVYTDTSDGSTGCQAMYRRFK